ncbi:hypothetical protein SLS62_003958 [Diatrype stigma]|uniref:Uncharacterized protein n=1 Tax=Diatrype stigma TaxID=117547 RepID=A0AAN9YTK9_9PEZI
MLLRKVIRAVVAMAYPPPEPEQLEEPPTDPTIPPSNLVHGDMHFGNYMRRNSATEQNIHDVALLMTKLISRDDSLSPGAARDFMRDESKTTYPDLAHRTYWSIIRALAADPANRQTIADLVLISKVPHSIFATNAATERDEYIQALVQELILNAPTPPDDPMVLD